jgi:regulator of protease activity HflC (stomatin/prohibitin superfamily)
MLSLRNMFVDQDGDPKVFNIVVTAVSLLFVTILLFIVWPFYTVPTGSRGVVTQFGKIVSIADEGLSILPPWQKLSLFSIRSETSEIKNAEGGTSDTQPVHVSMTVRYSIAVDKVGLVFEKYSHSGDLSSPVATATGEVFKAVTARYTAPDLIAKRQQVSNDIFAALQAKLDKYGATVINIDMTQFSFSDSYMKAINEKVTQEQLRLAAENKLRTIESEQKQKVAVAEADARALKAKADGEAYAKVAQATADAKAVELEGQAKAKAMQVQADALTRNSNLVELTKAERWDGKLPEAIYAGAPIPFLQMNSKPAK